MLNSRLSYLRTLWRQRVWARWFAAGWGVIGAAVLLRDELLSPEWQARLKVGAVATFLSWQTWAIILLVIVIAGLFEASFRAHRVEVETRRLAEEKLKPSGLKLSFHGNRALTPDPPGKLRYVFLVFLKNETGSVVTDCKIQLISVGKNGAEYASQLCDPFALLVDEQKPKPFAEYDLEGDRHLVLPTFWKERKGEWTRELGGVIAEESAEIILEALSSSARAVRLRLIPKFADGHWEFDVAP